MKISLLFALILIHNVVTDYNERADEEESNRKKILEQLTRTRTVLIEGYHLVTRQVATDVYMYRSYRTVAVIFFPVMRETVDARFLFQAEELHLNTIGQCQPREVIVNIKHGSYPAVNPDGYDFPKDFVDPENRETVYTIELLSDGKDKIFSLESPKPGNWYGIAYIKWEDPRTQSIDQQGLVALCQTILYSDLQIKKQEDIQLIDCYTGFTINFDSISNPSVFKCISLDNVDPINLNVGIENATETSRVTVRIQSHSIPTNTSYLVACSFKPFINNAQIITFLPNPSSWHYLSIESIPENFTDIADCESYALRTDLEGLNESVELMRDDKGRFFTFEYGLPTTDLQEATSLINMTSGAATTVRFKVNQFLDIGGTFTIEASLLMSLKYYMGYKRSTKDTSLAFTDENPFFRVVICMDIGHSSIPLESGLCQYNDRIRPALFILNSTDSDSIYEKVIIPYPESGMWYLTFKLFCDNVVCPCNTTDNGTKYYVDTKLDKENATVNSSETRLGDDECNATVVLSLSSSSCVNARCSNHGNCMINTYGGLVMSYCSCASGYGAWDCSDTSRMDSSTAMLSAVLLLTLSNLLFFFSVYIAIIRRYYPEAMMYAFTMIFSTFYHACDAPPQINYCIMRGHVLQFGDFYCGLMSFWVTLLAMSLVTDKIRTSLQLIGAIIIALLTTWNMHSFYSFLLPVVVGVLVVFVSWFLDFRINRRKMAYPRSYYTRYLPAGVILVSIGLICYAFLQTEQNYKIVHSVWHMIIALSVVCLLPDVNRGEGVNPFLPSDMPCGLLNCFASSRSPTPVTVSQSD